MFLLTEKVEFLIIDTKDLTMVEYEMIHHLQISKIFLTRSTQKPAFIPDIQSFEDGGTYHLGYRPLFEKILNIYNFKLCNTILLSKDPVFVKMVGQIKGIGTVLIQNEDIKENQYGFLPDFHLRTFNELSTMISNTNQGYFTEVSLTLNSDFKPKNITGYVINTQLVTDEVVVNIIAGGRYFNTRDWRYLIHQPSLRINHSKKYELQKGLFSPCYAGLVDYLKKTDPNIILSRVPPRKGKKDRFADIVTDISNMLSIQDVSNTLICEVDYPTHKTLGTEDRYDNVKGVFKTQHQDLFKGKHVVLIDDVLTSGATIYECAKVYYLCGAKKVTAIVLALNQFADEFSIDYKCKSCGGNMSIKINNKQNSTFFGCSNFYVSGCRYSINFEEGLYEIRNQLENFDDDNIF